MSETALFWVLFALVFGIAFTMGGLFGCWLTVTYLCIRAGREGRR